jgi:hypothetical protein
MESGDAEEDLEPIHASPVSAARLADMPNSSAHSTDVGDTNRSKRNQLKGIANVDNAKTKTVV